MKKIKVYDIDAFVAQEHPEYEAFRYKKAAIFEGPRGVVFAEEEAVHQKENTLTDSVVVPLAKRTDENHVAIFATADMTVSLDELIEKAPYEEMSMEEFFARRDYNPRCQNNYATLMDSLRKIGFDLNGYFSRDTKEVQEPEQDSCLQYNKIVKCNLEVNGTVSYRDIFLLTGDGIEVDEGFEVDLTGLFCFNTEFRSINREVVAVVNNVDELLAFCDKHNISVPSTCLEYEGCLSVGACCDYVLNNDLGVLGWEKELPENVLRKRSLEEQMNRAEAASAVSFKPDCPLIGQDGNIFNLMAIASKTLKKNDMAEQATEMCDRIQKSGSYDEALCILGEYVNITSVDKGRDER